MITTRPSRGRSFTPIGQLNRPTRAGAVAPTALLQISESGGDWTIDSGNGYQGGLQFSPATWQAYGGQGNAHEASREEQIAVAEKVQAEQGWGAWPACTKKLGLA